MVQHNVILTENALAWKMNDLALKTRTGHFAFPMSH